MSWCSDAPEDEAICLFAGLLANPDVPLSPDQLDVTLESSNIVKLALTWVAMTPSDAIK